MGSAPMLRARVYYDFASTLCYVAHRVFGELEPRLAELGVVLEWCPLDLAQLLGWRRGVPIDEARIANAERVAAELGVAVRPLPVWPDSRDALAAARASLERIAPEASEQGVTGLPTVMLGAFPFPGMQSRETTLLVFERWARKNRPPELVG